MDEQLAALREAFSEAGIDVPDDPTQMELAELDSLVDDRRLRGKCKSALVKFKRAAEEQGWSPGAAADGEAEPAVAEDAGESQSAAADFQATATVDEAAEEVEEEAPSAGADFQAEAPAAEEAPAPTPPTETAPAAEAAPMSDDLKQKHDALAEAFAAAGVEVPADPTAVDLDDLDAQVPDKKQRGKVKSALVKFRKQAEAEGWTAAAPVAEESPTPPPTAAPAAPPAEGPKPPAEPEQTATPPAPKAPAQPVEMPPMSDALQERFDAMEAAFAAAGVEMLDDPLSFDLNSLDALVEDKQARGKLKSSIVKFNKLAKEEGWRPAAASGGPADAQVDDSASSAGDAAPVAETKGDEEMIEIEVEEVIEDAGEAAEAAPMSADLQARYDELKAACDAGGIPVPDDPVNIDLGRLDEKVEDKKLRGRVKSASVKFRRQAEADGWQPAAAPTRRTRIVKKLVPRSQVEGQSVAEPESEASPDAGVFKIPSGSPSDLYLLTADGWKQLGTATRQPSQADEIVGQKTASGAVKRINNILILDGKFDVPEDLYNTYCYLAHEEMVYKAYYISHIGDVRRGTKTASLKVDEVYDYDTFRRAYVSLGRHQRPTADDARRLRFGAMYETDRQMFAEERARLT